MKIPKSFKLFATTINVVIDNKRMDDMNNYGLAEYSQSRITLATTHGVEALSDDKKMDTFYHEKVHCLLDALNKRELSGDEEFVDVFAKLLRQSDETAKY